MAAKADQPHGFMWSAIIVYTVLAAALWALLFLALGYVSRFSAYPRWLTAGAVVTFMYYDWDKTAAQNQFMRVPNRVLHSMALLGGVAGAWLGMFVWRHKYNHLAFWVVWILSTLIHGIILYWLHPW